MANQIGSASNLEDLFGKIVTFLTTDATLVAANQDWSILRQRRDNIAACTTNFTEPTIVGYRKTIQTCRYDPRSLNVDNPSSARYGNFYVAVATMGSSYVRWQLKTARDVRTVRLRSPLYSGDNQYMVRNFRLQYSDNGTSWTTALTVGSNPVYGVGEWKDFAVTSVGSHIYWQIIVDSVQSGTSNTAWASMLLIENDGTVANQFGSEVILKAPGNSGTESIYTGIRSEYDSSAGWYNLFVNGYTGYDPNEQSWFNQPGALPGAGAGSYTYAVPMIPCWDTTMPYWFVASGRSFRFAVKVSTSYEGGYLGYILQYATPGQYPYPLAVGGSLVPQQSARSSEWRYSYASWYHGVYPGPGCDNYASQEGRWATLYLRNSDGEWAYFANRGDGAPQPEDIYGPQVGTVAPYTPYGAWRSVWPHCMNDQWAAGKRPYRECLGGGYILQPCILLQRAPFSSVYGELEGTYAISGYQNAAENTTTVAGKTVVVFQQSYRNTVHEFWALSLD